jgi:6-pyruvoyltetrahydropterin/6-carboxytetrahydropterin synthase
LPSGANEPLHSHNWRVVAEISSEKLNKLGLVMDFRQLKRMVDNITGQFDGGPIEKLDYFKENGSSAEIVAKYIYEKLEPKMPKAVKLVSVKVVEEPGFRAAFGKKQNILQ